jgi:hypothetical protein
MKIYKIGILAIALLLGTVVTAQEKKQEGLTKESAKKTYKLYQNGELIKNSVWIETVRSQAVLLNEKDKNKIDQSRVIPPTAVIKTVKIDNDADDSYDEVIKFSYITEDKTDFTLVSSNDDLMVAVEDGENITILEDRTISIDGAMNSKKSYVFTTDNGNKVEFHLKSFERKNRKDSK